MQQPITRPDTELLWRNMHRGLLCGVNNRYSSKGQHAALCQRLAVRYPGSTAPSTPSSLDRATCDQATRCSAARITPATVLGAATCWHHRQVLSEAEMSHQFHELLPPHCCHRMPAPMWRAVQDYCDACLPTSATTTATPHCKTAGAM
jgi:hypothetical protein